MSAPERIPVVLLGWGPVGQAFLTAVRDRRGAIADRYGVDLDVVAVRRRTLVGAPGPPDAADALAWSEAGDLASLLGSVRPRVVVQAVPSDRDTLEDAFGQVVAAFAAGADVVTATKSHLVERWPELRSSAVASGRRIRVSAAAGAALPAADIAGRSVRGFDCRAIRGSLNGTSNFVLDALTDGASLVDAIERAQSLGIAEADPSADLEGRDTAAKLVILSNLVWDLGARIDAVEREPITEATAALARSAAAAGMALRSVATARPGPDQALQVRLEATAPDDPLHGLRGAEKGAVFDLGDAGSVLVAGGRSSPVGAALALLKDTLGLVAERPGFG